jgi:sporulation protein YlmC with PRC-barrel domain
MTGTAMQADVLRTRDFVGWEVVDRGGDKVGGVSDLLMDRRGRVRYIDVEYGMPRKHLLIPEHQLEWGDRKFIVSRWTRDELRSLPPYDAERPLEAASVEEMERAYPWVYQQGHASDGPPDGESRVMPLSDAKDFRIEKGASDLRGWNVFGSDGERIGKVEQMLVDPAALKIRYVDVDLLEDLFLLKDDRHVLIPLEHIDLKDRGEDAWVRRLTAAEVARLPAYTGGAVAPWMERSLGSAFE